MCKWGYLHTDIEYVYIHILKRMPRHLRKLLCCFYCCCPHLPFYGSPCKNWPLFSGGVAGREVELDGERDEGKIKPKL